MNKKDSFGKRAGDFFAGKGFYIVLILCVAVIGASAWAMLSSSNSDTGDGLDMDLAEPEDSTDNTGVETPQEQEDQATLAEQDEMYLDDDRETAGEEEPGEETDVTTDDPEDTEDTEPPADEETWAETEAEVETASSAELLFVWPVQGEIEVPHSMSELIYDRTMADWRTHAGIDITADLGEKVMAIAAGTVEQIYNDDLYGTTVVINHGGELRSVYSNLAETPTVAEGDWVESGTYIGAVGSTAIVETGIVSHLHLEVIQDGVRVDPLDYLPER